MNLEKAVLKYKNGDKKQFEYIYNQTIGLVRFAIYKYIQAKDTIEDLTQEVYMKVDKTIQNYSSSNFSNWIYTIAKNLAIDYAKRKKELLLEDSSYLCDRDKNPYLYYALNHLDENLKEVFLMKVLCGHTDRKIAEILNVSPSLVNKIYHQAKEQLKRSLEETNYEF